MGKFVVYYATITEDDEAGVFVDYPFFGGTAQNKEEAERLSRSLTNDRTLPGAIVAKIYEDTNTFEETMIRANKQFKQLSNDMYQMEDIHTRMKKK